MLHPHHHHHPPPPPCSRSSTRASKPQILDAMAAVELEATPPRSASPTLNRRLRSRIPAFSKHTTASIPLVDHHSMADALPPHHLHHHHPHHHQRDQRPLLPPSSSSASASHVLSPICLNSAMPTSVGGGDLKSKPAAPPSTPPNFSKLSTRLPLHADELQNADVSSSPAMESPLISMSVDDDEEANGKKEEIMVWTNAMFQANSCEEMSSECTSSVDPKDLPYRPPLTVKSSHVVKPLPMTPRNGSNTSSIGECTDQHSLADKPTSQASGDELEAIEMQIKQLTDQLKKLQAQKEQVVAKRRNVCMKQRSRLAGVAVAGVYGLNSGRPGSVAVSQSSLMPTRLSHGVPTFKGLRTSQPMKKKQYIPSSSRVRTATVAMRGEDAAPVVRGKRPESCTRPGYSAAMVAARSGGAKTYGWNGRGGGGGGGGGSASARNSRGVVAMSSQMANMNMRSAVAQTHAKTGQPPPPAREVAAPAPPMRPSPCRRTSGVAKSLLSFINAGSRGNPQLSRGAQNEAPQEPVLLPPPPPTIKSTASKTTAALHERLELLLRESQVFFGLRRSRTAPSTPQAKAKAHNYSGIESMIDPSEEEERLVDAAAPSAVPTAHLSNDSSPSSFDQDDLMRRLQAIAASHHETSTMPPPPPKPLHTEDSKSIFPALPMNGTDQCSTDSNGFLSEDLSSIRALQMYQIASPGPRTRMRWHQKH